MTSSLGFLKDIFYSLKRDYGRSIDIYKIVFENDIQTGSRRIVSRTKITIKRAILVPITDQVLATYLRAGLNNVDRRSGGYIELEDQFLIIDRKDLPKNFRLDQKDYIVVKSKDSYRNSLSSSRIDIESRDRYEVSEIMRYDQHGLVCVVRSVEGVDIAEIVSLNLEHSSPYDLLLEQFFRVQLKLNISVEDQLEFTDLVGYEWLHIPQIYEEDVSQSLTFNHSVVDILNG